MTPMLRSVGKNLAQETETLGGEIGCLVGQPGGVAARSTQTRDHAGADRVPCDREDNRDDSGRPLGRKGCFGSYREYHIDLDADELGCDLGETFGTSLGPTLLDRDGAALDPTEFAHPLHKRSDPGSLRRRRAGAEDSDGRHFFRRLWRAQPAAMPPPRRREAL